MSKASIRKLLYVSSATVGFDDASLEALVKQSAENNERLGVSGVLLFRDGNFCQLLEGPAEIIEALTTRIRQDRRHTGFTVIADEEHSERSVPFWSMHLTESDRICREAQIDFEMLIHVWSKDVESARLLHAIERIHRLGVSSSS